MLGISTNPPELPSAANYGFRCEIKSADHARMKSAGAARRE